MTYKIHKLFPSLFILISLTSNSIAHNQTNSDNQFLCSNGKQNPRTAPPPFLWTRALVQTKDIQIQPATGLSGRLYLPKFGATPFMDLPPIIYFHGGGAFCSGSAYSLPYHKFSLRLAARSMSIILSVQYRSAPAHSIRVGYDDSWTALKWVASHSNSGLGPGHDPWIKHHTNFNRVFLAGDGVGANIAHTMGIWVGLENLGGVNISSVILMHPLLWGEKLKLNNEWGERRKVIYGVKDWAREWVSHLWSFVCPSSSGLGDPSVNPALDPDLRRMGCKRVVVFVAGDDPVAKGNYGYVAALRGSGWRGVVEIVESKGKKNEFYLDPKYDTGTEAMDLIKKVVSFISRSRKAYNGTI